MNYDKLIDFLIYAGKLKQVKRTGWVQAGIINPESVSDHSYRVSLLAMVLSDLKGLDTEKVVKMAVLHDLAESITGDQAPNQKKVNHQAVENRAMKELLALLPTDIRGEYAEIWLDYREESSEEAELVYAADKLEMILQACEYSKERNYSPRLGRFLDVTLPRGYEELNEAIKNRFSMNL